jgi:hypothetical protein
VTVVRQLEVAPEEAVRLFEEMLGEADANSPAEGEPTPGAAAEQEDNDA